ncbi:HIT family protein [Candidatus Woesearchaeota archaeon]|nr:HIT family protein [Candidatus Woesearchaeota archaeon]
MNADLPEPKRGAVFFEDEKLYATLANYPISKGHVVVVWKNKVRDLHLLTKKEYEHLMDVIDLVRDAMLKVLKIKKVYLMYMDEANHVHWHLVPRYAEKGMNVLIEKPGELANTRLSPRLKKEIELLSK